MVTKNIEERAKDFYNAGHSTITILSVGIEDFEFQVRQREDYALADEEWVDDAKEHLELARSMTPQEWQFFGTLVSDYLWRSCNLGEAFQDALEAAIEEMGKLRTEELSE